MSHGRMLNIFSAVFVCFFGLKSFRWSCMYYFGNNILLLWLLVFMLVIWWRSSNKKKKCFLRIFFLLRTYLLANAKVFCLALKSVFIREVSMSFQFYLPVSFFWLKVWTVVMKCVLRVGAQSCSKTCWSASERAMKMQCKVPSEIIPIHSTV